MKGRAEAAPRRGLGGSMGRRFNRDGSSLKLNVNGRRDRAGDEMSSRMVVDCERRAIRVVPVSVRVR